MNDIRKLAGQTLIYGFGTIVPRFLNYAVLTPFYTRIFKLGEYGVVTELYAWIAMVMVILTYGMETTYFRFIKKEKNKEQVYSTSLVSLFVTSALFVIAVNLFIHPVSAFLNYSAHSEYIRMFSWIVAIDAFSAIPFAYLRGNNRPIVFSAIKVANVLVTLAMVFFFFTVAPELLKNGNTIILKVYNPDFGVGYVFLANLIGSGFTLICLTPFLWRIKPRFDSSLWRRMINYSWPLMIGGFAGSFNDMLDKILLRRIIGGDTALDTVGEYGAGYKVGVLMSLFIQMYRFAAEPFFFERAGNKDAKATYAITMKYFVIVALILYLVMNLYIEGVQIIIGPSFRESLFVVPIISMGYFLFGIFVNQSIWYKIEDKTIYGVYLTLLGAGITVLINVIFIPVYGYAASAWAHVACYLAMVVVSFIIGQKHYPVDYDLKGIIGYSFIAVLLVILSRWVATDVFWIDFFIDSAFLAIFIIIAQRRDNIFNVFLKNNV